MAALNAFARVFWDMPPVTRMYMTASVMTTVAVQLEIISPFQLYFNPKLIFRNHQYWRLLTTFLFFGPVGFNFLFNVIFTYRYCRMLEEEFYRNRTADFFYMFLIGGTLMSMLAYFVNLLFLGHAFTIMLVYIWSRRNPRVRMNFFGLLTFQAPYLPWVLLGFSILLGSSTVVDIIGIVVGHFYYFFEDVFPNGPHGFRVLETPRFIKVIFTRLGLEEPILDENDRQGPVNLANDPPQQQQQPPNNQPQQHQHQPQAQADNQQQEPINRINSPNIPTSSDTQTNQGPIDPNEVQTEQQRVGVGSTDNSTQALRARNVTTGETN